MKRTVFHRPSEEFHYAITFAGRSAGRERWSAHLENDLWSIKRETTFAGPLSHWGQRWQFSQINPANGLPKKFSEGQDSDKYSSNNGKFAVFFDEQAGVVRLNNGSEVAEKPMTIDMHDPISLLEMLRGLKPEFSIKKVPMINSQATVELVREEIIPTYKGEKLTHVYSIYPGGAFVYVQAEEPHEIFRFEQWIDDSLLQSSLISDTFEAVNHEHRRKNNHKSSTNRSEHQINERSQRRRVRKRL